MPFSHAHWIIMNALCISLLPIGSPPIFCTDILWPFNISPRLKDYYPFTCTRVMVGVGGWGMGGEGLTTFYCGLPLAFISYPNLNFPFLFFLYFPPPLLFLIYYSLLIFFHRLTSIPVFFHRQVRSTKLSYLPPFCSFFLSFLFPDSFFFLFFLLNFIPTALLLLLCSSSLLVSLFLLLLFFSLSSLLPAYFFS